MGSTLEHGIYLPSEGEKNCYQGLASNWNKVDGALGDVAGLKQLIESKFTKEIVTELPTEDINPYCIYMILKTDPETNNIYDEWVYINNNWEYLGNTKVDMTQYYTKQEVNQLPAVASGVTSTKVGNYDAHIANGDIHVTASDKAKWDTVALIKQLRLVNTQVGSATTIAFANIDDTNGIKVGDKCMDLDGKMFEITAVDATNETVTVGSALIDIALDPNVVHNSGAETISGIKSFADIPIFTSFDGIRFRCAHNSNAYVTFRNVGQTDAGSIVLSANDGTTSTSVHLVNKTFVPYNNNDTDLGSGSKSWKDSYAYHGYFRGQQQNDEYSGNARTNLTLLANRDTLGTSGCLIDSFRENTTQGTGSHIIGFGIRENSVRYEGCRFSWLWNDNLGGYRFAFRPTLQGTNQAVEHNIGLSTDKWDKINGVEPSSLGMPDFDNAIDISGYVTVVANVNKESLYTPPANGWVCVRLSRTSGALGVLLIQGDLAISGKNVEVESGVTTADATIPVIGGVQVSINSASADGVVSAKFFPCLGNV